MGEATAVRVAIDLLRVPSRARLIRQAPLPDGMELLLRIAARDRAAIDATTILTERSEAVLRQAAEFFIEQILLSPESESYRVLGANHDAPSGELRRNMALLVRWMHPDVAETIDRSVFAGRVTLAWENLKTAERRAAYDRTTGIYSGATSASKSSFRTSKLSRQRVVGLRRLDRLHRLGGTESNVFQQPGLLRRAWQLLLRRS